MIILHICRGTIPENLRRYVHGEPSEFVDKKQLLALGSRLFMLLKLINLIVEQGIFLVSHVQLWSDEFDYVIVRVAVLMEGH